MTWIWYDDDDDDDVHDVFELFVQQVIDNRRKKFKA